MKKLTYLLFLAIGVTACSVESMDSTENLLTADARFYSQSAVTISPPDGVLCIGETYPFSFSASTTKTTQVQWFSEELNDYIQVFKSNDGVQGTVYFDVVAANVNKFRTIIAGVGQTDYPETFNAIKCNPCENSLEVDFVCGETNTATFTFTAVEAGPIVIQGGLNNWAVISNASSNVLTENTTHPSVVNSSSSVTRWEGTVEACQVVTVTIEFSGGNGIGGWSAKRGEDVLGATLAQGCPTE